MRKLFNGLKITSIVISCLLFILELICLLGEWEGISLYVMLLQVLFVLTLVNKNAPFSYKLVLTLFNMVLLARNIYITNTLDVYVLFVWLIAILQPIGLWVKYKKK